MSFIVKFAAPSYYALTGFLAANEDERSNKTDGLLFLWLICSGVFKMRLKTSAVGLIACMLEAMIQTIVIRIALALFCPHSVRIGAPFCLILLDFMLILSYL